MAFRTPPPIPVAEPASIGLRPEPQRADSLKDSGSVAKPGLEAPRMRAAPTLHRQATGGVGSLLVDLTPPTIGVLVGGLQRPPGAQIGEPGLCPVHAYAAPSSSMRRKASPSLQLRVGAPYCI